MAVHSERPGMLTQADLEECHPWSFDEWSLGGAARGLGRRCRGGVSARRLRGSLAAWVPALKWIPKYKPREYLFNDLLAGITNGIMNIPQGMAYGMLAGLDPAHGLYTSFFLPLIYTFFGTSKHVALGTFAIVSLMNGQAVDAIAHSVMMRHNTTAAANGTIPSSIYTWFCGGTAGGSAPLALAIEISGALTLMMGLIQIVLSLLRLGFLAVLLSDQLVQGLTSGAAMFVMTVQVKHLFGIESLHRPTGILGLIKFYSCFFIHIEDTNFATLITSIICISFLVFIKEVVDPRTRPKIKFPIPGELIVVLRLETPSMPLLGTYALDVVAPAATIAIVLFSIECSLAKLFAKKHDYEIDPNQEFFALGLTHAVASLFGCHCGGSSLSRSMIQSNQGAKSQVPSLIAAAIVLLVLCVAAPLFTDLPKCVLSSIIVVALKGMYKQIGNLPPLWAKSKVDFFVWLVTFGGVLLLGITYGLFTGLGFSLLTVIARSLWPYYWRLERPPSVRHYVEAAVYEGLRGVPRLRVFRFDAPLYYANTELFKDALYREMGVNPLKIRKNRRKADKVRRRGLKKEGTEETIVLSNERACEVATDVDVSWIVVDCSCLAYVDLMGVEALNRIRADLATVDVTLVLASCHAEHLRIFANNDFFKEFPKSHIFLTVQSAVTQFKSVDCNGLISVIEESSKIL